MLRVNLLIWKIINFRHIRMKKIAIVVPFLKNLKLNFINFNKNSKKLEKFSLR